MKTILCTSRRQRSSTFNKKIQYFDCLLTNYLSIIPSFKTQSPHSQRQITLLMLINQSKTNSFQWFHQPCFYSGTERKVYFCIFASRNNLSRPFINEFNFYLEQIRYFKQMSKNNAKAPAGKAPVSQPKAAEKKVWKADDYATLTIPVEEVKDIKTAFDIFDGDQSGVVDPQELKRAFEQLGFSGQNKFVYQILAELDDDQSGGIDFKEFLRLATAKLSDKDSREEVDKVWKSFDINNAGKITTLELKKVAKDLGEDLNDEEIEKIFVKADLDDDGFVTNDDFYNILTHKVYWEQ